MSSGLSSRSGKCGPYGNTPETGNKLVALATKQLPHTFPFTISTVIPIACGTTRISLKMMAASRSNLARGCRDHYYGDLIRRNLSTRICYIFLAGSPKCRRTPWLYEIYSGNL